MISQFLAMISQILVQILNFSWLFLNISLRFSISRCDSQFLVAILIFSLRFPKSHCDSHFLVAISKKSHCDFQKSHCDFQNLIAIFKISLRFSKISLRFSKISLRFSKSHCDFFFLLRFCWVFCENQFFFWLN